MPVTANAAGLLRGVEQLGIRMARRLGDEFVDEARSGVSRRTRKTYESIKADPPIVFTDKIEVRVEVGEKSGVYQDQGTGIFGPEGRRITSLRPGGVLRFDWPAAGGIVFARSVAGSPGTHFWTKAIEAWPRIVRRISAGG